MDLLKGQSALGELRTLGAERVRRETYGKGYEPVGESAVVVGSLRLAADGLFMRVDWPLKELGTFGVGKVAFGVLRLGFGKVEASTAAIGIVSRETD